MKFTFLGTGTSQGVPVIGCDCPVCRSNDPRDNRLRSSGFISSHSAKILIDCGPDFRYQMLRSGHYDYDAIILTHEHYDHVAGLDDVRPINYVTGRDSQVFADERTYKAVHKNLEYVFKDNPPRGIPKIDLIDHQMKPFKVGNLEIIPLQVFHGKLPITAYRIRNFAYVTDVSFIPEETFRALEGVEVLVIDALRFKEHPTHFNLDQALEAIARIAPKRAYLTHFCHEIGLHLDLKKKLPEGVFAGYDGLSFEI